MNYENLVPQTHENVLLEIYEKKSKLFQFTTYDVTTEGHVKCYRSVSCILKHSSSTLLSMC